MSNYEKVIKGNYIINLELMEVAKIIVALQSKVEYLEKLDENLKDWYIIGLIRDLKELKNKVGNQVNAQATQLYK